MSRGKFIDSVDYETFGHLSLTIGTVFVAKRLEVFDMTIFKGWMLLGIGFVFMFLGATFLGNQENEDLSFKL